MPFTPFHFGPGIAVKGIAPEHYSFSAFVLAQGLIDVEPLYYILRQAHPVHRQLHTFAGAAAAGCVAAGCVVAGRALVRKFLPQFYRPLTSTPEVSAETSSMGTLTGGLGGALSHPLLDAIMHPDLHPFSPWGGANPFLGFVSTGTLYTACLAAGLVGTVLVLLRCRPRD
jgi:hypothetical protein